jgi:hypothetical protein
VQIIRGVDEFNPNSRTRIGPTINLWAEALSS